ncbi:MAG: ankyrin repeat domain-containing protein [Deltaproteobacteria bacterium]|nr:ankyrin repeat domain-containing protein [Deltaproteobacteria bacterium]
MCGDAPAGPMAKKVLPVFFGNFFEFKDRHGLCYSSIALRGILRVWTMGSIDWIKTKIVDIMDWIKGRFFGRDLVEAIKQGNSQTRDLLLGIGAAVNMKDRQGKTALLYAAERGDSDTARLLLERGAYVNVEDREGVTPLMAACDKRHLDVTRILLSHGADVAALDREGWSALTYAV